MLVVGRSGRRARAGGLGGSFRTPPHPRKIPPARTKRVDDRQGGVWGTGQIAGVLPPPHTHTRTPHRLPPPFAHVSVSCAVFSDTILCPPSTAQSTRRSACRLLSGSRSWVSLVSSSSLFSSRSTTSSWEETRRRLRRLRRLERILLRGGVKQYTTINHKVGAGRCEVGTPNKTKKQEAP